MPFQTGRPGPASGSQEQVESVLGNKVLFHQGLEEMTQQERLGKTQSGTRRRQVGLASEAGVPCDLGRLPFPLWTSALSN